MLDLNFFDKYQGKMLSLDDAKEIKKNQKHIARMSFKLGFKYIRENKNTKIASMLIDLNNKIHDSSLINNPAFFRKEQEKLYDAIHKSNLDYFYKIFFEYLTGLSRFTLSLQVLFKYLLSVTKNNDKSKIETTYQQLFNQGRIYCLDSYFDRLSKTSEAGRVLISYLTNYYFLDTDASKNFWDQAEKYFLEKPSINSLAKDLVSIQYVPFNKRYLGIMQSIHWCGFGGSGELLLEFDQLKSLAIHSISHHSNYSIEKDLNKRLNAFKLPLSQMLSKTQEKVINYLTHHFPDGQLNIYDFCSGPKFNALRGIIEKMQKRHFNLTVSDVDGASLLSLFNEKETLNYKNLDTFEIRYEDLALPLVVKEEEHEKYHLVNVTLGLHQLPIEEIYTAIKHFAEITKIGGLISNLDASKRRYLQLVIIPGNIVDREGHVPYIEELELTQLVIDFADNDCLKLAYPLVNLSKKVFDEVNDFVGVGPYTISFYTPVLLEREEFEKLNRLWNLKRYDDCDKIIGKDLGI